MDYLLLVAFVLLETFLIMIYDKAKKKGVSYLSFFLGLILTILFCALRKVENVPGTDSYEYFNIYRNASGLSLFEYLSRIGQADVGFYTFFWIFSKFNLDYKIVRIAYYVTLYFLTIKSIKISKYKKNEYTDFFFLATNLLLAHSMMRMSLAYAICWFAVGEYLEGKRKKSICCISIACLIHFSSIILFSYIFFIEIMSRIKRYGKAVLFFLIFVISSSFMFSKIINIIAKYNYKVHFYSVLTSTGSFAWTANIYRLVLIVMITVSCNLIGKYKTDEKVKKVFLSLLFSLIIIPLQLTNTMAYRFLAFFDIINFGTCDCICKTNQRHLEGYVISLNRIIINLFNLFILYRFIIASTVGYRLIPISW